MNATTRSELKRELVSTAQLLRNQQGRVRSARTFLDRLGVSREGVEAVKRALPRPELMDESFRFDVGEFDRHIRYRMVELNTGAMLMADDARFDEVFQYELGDAAGVVRYSTEGEVIDRRYRTRK